MTPEQQEKQWRIEFDAWKGELEARKPLMEAVARYAELAIKSLLLISGHLTVLPSRWLALPADR